MRGLESPSYEDEVDAPETVRMATDMKDVVALERRAAWIEATRKIHGDEFGHAFEQAGISTPQEARMWYIEEFGVVHPDFEALLKNETIEAEQRMAA